MQKSDRVRLASLLKNGDFYIETQRSVEETRAFCKKLEPWRVVYSFSNGVRTDEFEKRDFVYNPRPLGKLKIFHEKFDLSQFKEKKVLDIGFNEGYHSLFFAKYLASDVDGIEVYQDALDRVSKLSDFLDVKVNLTLADANTYRKENTYDLIVHCGTLYHLHDTWSAIKNAAESLKQNGYLLLETITYKGQDDFDCRFINMLNKGHNNFWALSKPTIKYMFAEYGVSHYMDVKDHDFSHYAGPGMKRSLQIFFKD